MRLLQVVEDVAFFTRRGESGRRTYGQKGGGGATAACDGKVLRVDVGMSRCGGNTSEGVEILNGGRKLRGWWTAKDDSL